MKQLLALLLAFAFYCPVFAQDADAEELVKEGIALHDAGKYEEAIAKYDAALKADPKYIDALYEKANTLSVMNRNEESLGIAKQILKDYPSYSGLPAVYMAAGNALDDLKRSEEALKMYNDGLKRFPQFNMLYYNKGMTLLRLNDLEEAKECFEKDILLKPVHASGHRLIAQLYEHDENLVPALFSNGVFLLRESTGKRAQDAFAAMKKVVKGNATVDSGKNGQININLFMPKQSKKKEDDFSVTNMSLSLISSLGIDKVMDSLGAKQTDIDKMKMAFNMAIESTEKESKKKGFAWKYYVPFFADMKKRNYVEAFCNLCFRPTDNKEAATWLAANEKEVTNFYDWMEGYAWPKKID